MDIEKLEKSIRGHFDGYELYLLKERTKRFESRDGGIYGADLKAEEGIALRAVQDGRMVFSYTYETDEKAAADRLVENSLLVAPYVEQDRDSVLPCPARYYPTLPIFDEEGIARDDREKGAIAVKMEELIRSYDSRIAATRNCEFHESEAHVTMVNSEGVRTEASNTLFTVVGMAVAKDIDEVSWYDWAWAHRLRDIDVESLARRIAAKAVSFLGGDQIETGRYAGILTPQASSDILAVLSDSFLAESLFKNKTRLKDGVGTSPFSETVTIIDSGLTGMDSFPFDGEGTPSQVTVVVNRGRFETFLYDSYYGKKFGRASTGNAVRGSVREAPHNGPRNLFIDPGSVDVTETFSDGIVIEELMGTHTANSITGEFSLGALGYHLKDGRREPFKGVVFSGNIFDLLSNVEAVGNDLRFYGSTGSPSLLFRDLRISGS